MATVEPVTPDDAPRLVALSHEWGQEAWMWEKGSAGLVVRDALGISGFALLCEKPYGQVLEEFWCPRTTRGKRAANAIIHWVEENVKKLGQERGTPMFTGGIQREGTPLYNALKKHGYGVSHHVLTKQVA